MPELSEASQSDVDQLEALLCDDPQALTDYICYMSLLADVELTLKPELLSPPTAADPASPVLGFLAPAVNVAASWLTSPKVLALALLGSLATYFAGLMISIAISRARLTDRNAQQRAESPAVAAARIIAASECRWQDHSRRADLGAALPAGTSRLTEGVVEIEFDGGARVRIQGPAAFAPRSGHSIELTEGRLLAYVPKAARGFTVDTPTAEVIDLGTEFGVAVDRQAGTDVHVLRGHVEVKAASKAPGPQAGEVTKLSAGQAVRITADQSSTSSIPFDEARFAAGRFAIAAQPGASVRTAAPFPPGQPIWLGNLFDDPPHTSLADAMRSDTFRAGADFNDLGVDRVGYGGEAVQEIAPGVKFDLTNLGWGKGELRLQIANDAWSAAFGGIRLKGEPLGQTESKIDEGIGIAANAFLTFGLDEIRAAGKLGSQTLEFVCDSAGVNDTGMNPAPTLNMEGGGSIHLLVLVASGSDVLSANVDGAAAQVVQRDGCWSVAEPPVKALHTYGPYISVRLPIPAQAKYLTLVTTGAGDNHWDDHGVWVGARLEVVQTPSAAKALSER